MIKKNLVRLLALLMMSSPFPVSIARAQSEQANRAAQKAKEKISKLALQASAPVALSLRDGRKITGYLSSLTDEHFNIADYKTGATTTIAFAEVKRVESAPKQSMAHKGYLIFALAGLGIAVAALAASLAHPD